MLSTQHVCAIQAVCSFKISQLPSAYPNVLFFHGLNGLENACDNGVVPRGQWVLFNGASFLLDLSKRGIAVHFLRLLPAYATLCTCRPCCFPWLFHGHPMITTLCCCRCPRALVLHQGSILTVAQQGSGIDPSTGQPYNSTAAAREELPMLIDPFMWRQFVALSERYGFVGGLLINHTVIASTVTAAQCIHNALPTGGIYIQEPDASPANVDALCSLVNQQPIYLPLGFAFGNVSGTTVTFPDLMGRGFAAQQLLEELAAKKELGAKVWCKRP